MRKILFSLFFLLATSLVASAQTTKPANVVDGETFRVLVVEQIEVDYHRWNNTLDITIFNADHTTTDVYYGPASSATMSATKATFTAPGVDVVVDMKTGDVTYNGVCYTRPQPVASN